MSILAAAGESIWALVLILGIPGLIGILYLLTKYTDIDFNFSIGELFRASGSGRTRTEAEGGVGPKAEDPPPVSPATTGEALVTGAKAGEAAPSRNPMDDSRYKYEQFNEGLESKRVQGILKFLIDSDAETEALLGASEFAIGGSAKLTFSLIRRLLSELQPAFRKLMDDDGTLTCSIKTAHPDDDVSDPSGDSEKDGSNGQLACWYLDRNKNKSKPGTQQRVSPVSLPRDGTLPGAVFDSGNAIDWPDTTVRKNIGFDLSEDEAARIDNDEIASMLGCPIWLDDEVVAVLVVDSQVPNSLRINQGEFVDFLLNSLSIKVGLFYRIAKRESEAREWLLEAQEKLRATQKNLRELQRSTESQKKTQKTQVKNN